MPQATTGAVVLNGVKYATAGAIRSQEIQSWAEPIRNVGNLQRSDRIGASQWVMEGFSSGLGYYTTKGVHSEDPRQRDPSFEGLFESRAETRWAGQVTLPGEFITTTNTPADDYYRFVHAGSNVYTFSENVQESIGILNIGGPNFAEDTDLASGDANFIGYAVIPHNGDVYVLGGNGTTIAAAHQKWSGGSWAAFTPGTQNVHNVPRTGLSFKDIMYVATYHSDHIVRIESSSNDGATWGIIAGMEVTDTVGDIIEMVMYYDSNGAPVPYLHTSMGLYLMDVANSDLIPIREWKAPVQVNQNVVFQTGRPQVFGGNLYLPRGRSLQEFNWETGAMVDVSLMTSGARVPTDMTPDAAMIGGLYAHDNWLFVAIAASGTNFVYAIDKSGAWHYIFHIDSKVGAAGQTKAIRDITMVKDNVTFKGDVLHIVYDHGGTHAFVHINYLNDNPRTVSGKTFEASGYVTTPYFDAGMSELPTGVFQTGIGASGLDSAANNDDKITVSTAVDFTDSFANAVTYYSDTDPLIKVYTTGTKRGIAAKAWQHKITLARGSTKTLTPTLFFASTYFRKKVKNLHEYRFVVDLRETVLLDQRRWQSPENVLEQLALDAGDELLLTFEALGVAAFPGGSPQYVEVTEMVTQQVNISNPQSSDPQLQEGQVLIALRELVST